MGELPSKYRVAPVSTLRYSPGLTTIPGRKRTPCSAMLMSHGNDRTPASGNWHDDMLMDLLAEG
jgi:hypothetical protein